MALFFDSEPLFGNLERLDDCNRPREIETTPPPRRSPLPRRPPEIRRSIRTRPILSPRRRPYELDEKMGRRIPGLCEVRQRSALHRCLRSRIPFALPRGLPLDDRPLPRDRRRTL